MDVGRLAATIPMVLGFLPSSSFGPLAFEKAQKQQGKAATKAWDEFGIKNADDFLYLEKVLRAAYGRTVVKDMEPPAWALKSEQLVASPMVCVALCEYGECVVDKVDMSVLDVPPSFVEQRAIHARLQELREHGRDMSGSGKGGKCFMSILMDVLMRARSLQYVETATYASKDINTTRLATAVVYGLCPKISWQGCTEVYEMIDGIRQVHNNLLSRLHPCIAAISTTTAPESTLSQRQVSISTGDPVRCAWLRNTVVECRVCGDVSSKTKTRWTHFTSKEHRQAVRKRLDAIKHLRGKKRRTTGRNKPLTARHCGNSVFNVESLDVDRLLHDGDTDLDDSLSTSSSSSSGSSCQVVNSDGEEILQV